MVSPLFPLRSDIGAGGDDNPVRRSRKAIPRIPGLFLIYTNQPTPRDEPSPDLGNHVLIPPRFLLELAPTGPCNPFLVAVEKVGEPDMELGSCELEEPFTEVKGQELPCSLLGGLTFRFLFTYIRHVYQSLRPNSPVSHMAGVRLALRAEARLAGVGSAKFNES